MVLLTKREYHEFQFTRPRGARPDIGGDDDELLSFNSRAREGRDPRFGSICRKVFCFNSRAREGRDVW